MAEGGCLCRAIRYETSGEPMAVAACHCRDCQYYAGGPSVNVLFPVAQVKLTKGAVAAYAYKADSGNVIERQFCAACGMPLFSMPRNNPGLAIVKIGTFDDPAPFKIGVEIWTKSAHPWTPRISGVPSLPGQPPI